MTIKKHTNGVYYAHYMTATGPTQLSLRTKDRAEAVVLAREAKIENIERLAKANALTQEAITRAVAGRRVTGSAALTVWEQWAVTVGLQPNTRRQYAVQLNAFLRDAGLSTKPVSAIDAEALNAWVNGAVTLASRMGRMRAVKNFCDVLSGKGYIHGQPARLIRIRMDDLSHDQKESKSPDPFTPEETRTLLANLPPEWAAMSALSLHTGFRLGDSARIEWGCFTPSKGVAIWMDKTDKRLELPLPKQFFSCLSEVEKAQSWRSRFVFPMFADLAADPKTRSHLSTYFSREAKRAGVEGKSFHSWRHTFATDKRRLGESIDEIRQKLGHALSDTTLTYVHVE